MDLIMILNIIVTVVSAVCAVITIYSMCLSKGVLSKIRLLRDCIQMERSKDVLQKMQDECDQLNMLLNPLLAPRGVNATKKICEICVNLKKEFNELQTHPQEIVYKSNADITKCVSDLTDVIAGSRALSVTSISLIQMRIAPILHYYSSECDKSAEKLSK